MGPLFGYLDESGLPGSAGYFVVGLVQTGEPETHLPAIQGLRNQTGYRRELRYSSNDQQRLPFAEALIHYFFGANDLEFIAGIVGPASGVHKSPYATHYRRLLGLSSRPRSDRQLFLEVRTSDGRRDQELADALSPLATVDFDLRPKSDLLQLADLFAGSVFGDLTFPLRNEGNGKAQLIAAIKHRLGVASLADRRLVRPGRFRVLLLDGLA